MRAAIDNVLAQTTVNRLNCLRTAECAKPDDIIAVTTHDTVNPITARNFVNTTAEAIHLENVIPRAAIQKIRQRATDNHIIARRTRNNVEPTATNDLRYVHKRRVTEIQTVRLCAAIDDVLALTTINRLNRLRAAEGPQPDNIIAVATHDTVNSVTTRNFVNAIAGAIHLENVIPRAAVEEIVAATSGQCVSAETTFDFITIGIPGNYVIRGAANDVFNSRKFVAACFQAALRHTGLHINDNAVAGAAKIQRINSIAAIEKIIAFAI